MFKTGKNLLAFPYWIAIACTIIVIVSSSSCTTQKKLSEQLNTWIGATKKDLIMSWGPPSSITSDGDGGEVLIYAQRIYVPAYRIDYYNYKLMYVNSRGTIYHWLTRRSPNPPEQIDVNLFVH